MNKTDKDSLMRFHSELKTFCSSIDWHCDAGDGNEELDCPFTRLCYFIPKSIEAADIEKAVDTLNDRFLPDSICARVFAHRCSVYPELRRNKQNKPTE